MHLTVEPMRKPVFKADVKAIVDDVLDIVPVWVRGEAS